MTINRNLSILAGGVSNTGVLSVPYGGTGNVSMTVGYIPYGNGTSAFSSSANFTYNGTVLSINSGSSQVPLALSNNNSNALTASFTNTNNNAVLSIGVGGSGGFGITNWANSILIEGSPAGAGGTLIGSYTGPIYFQVNGRTVQAMQIAPSGGVSIGNTTDPGAGNLRFSTAGTNGIYFGSSSILTDYEEGTWTPADASGAGLSLTVNNARYTKIGNRVLISAYVTYPATANTNPIFISGLPFTSASSFRQLYVGTSSATVITGFQISGGSTTGALTLTDGSLAINIQMSGKYFMLNGHYEV